MSLIVNLFAGPGAGKSTLAYQLTGLLKANRISAELAPEFAKDLTWEARDQTIQLQPYVFGKQYKRISILNNKVDVVVTDSPILLCYFYAAERYPPSFKQSILDIFKTMNNLNFFVDRVKPYDPNGRNQTEDEARNIDGEVLGLLVRNEISFRTIKGNDVESLYKYVTWWMQNVPDKDRSALGVPYQSTPLERTWRAAESGS